MLKVVSMGFGCCGFIPNTSPIVCSALVFSENEEEIDEFLRLGKEQDKLFKEWEGMSFKFFVPVDDAFVAAYCLPYIDYTPQLKDRAVSPKVLERTSGGWRIIGGTVKPSEMSVFLSKCGYLATQLDLEGLYEINGFGTNSERYREKKRAVLSADGCLVGVVFAAREEDWVKKEIASIHKEFDVLLDIPFHNYRYSSDASDHDLQFILFKSKGE